MYWKYTVKKTDRSGGEQDMQQIITREQLWERIGQLDPFQQQSVVAFIDSILKPKTLEGKTRQESVAFLVGLGGRRHRRDRGNAS